MDNRRKKTKTMYVVLGGIILICAIARAVLFPLTGTNTILSLVRAFLGLLSTAAFICLLITVFSSLKLSKSVSYNKENGTSEYMSGMDTSNPAFSAESLRYFGFNFYDNGEGFFIDRPGITLKYDDISEIKVIRKMAHRNVFALAYGMSKPLLTVSEGKVEIGDRCMLMFRTKSNAKFVSNPMVPEDAQNVINFILTKNADINLTANE